MVIHLNADQDELRRFANAEKLTLSEFYSAIETLGDRKTAMSNGVDHAISVDAWMQYPCLVAQTGELFLWVSQGHVMNIDIEAACADRLVHDRCAEWRDKLDIGALDQAQTYLNKALANVLVYRPVFNRVVLLPAVEERTMVFELVARRRE